MSQTVKHQIKHRFTDAVLFECDVPTEIESGLHTRYALEKATQARANLADANLAGANLAGTNLVDANLAGANLAGAKLAGTKLAGANLADANLAGAKWINGTPIARAPLQLFGLRWNITIVDAHMQIGCQMHALHAWDAFTDEEISEMDSDALEFWTAHKSFLIGMARADGRSFEPVEQAAEAA